MTIEPTFTTQAAVTAAAGGALIGIASALLLAGNGRIAGISGIAGKLMGGLRNESGWRLAFLAGLLAGSVALLALAPQVFGSAGWAPAGQLVAAGLLVGYGTQLGNGCTSGHGVCGLARRSPRSLTATLTFMGIAGAVVFVVRHLQTVSN